MKAWAIKFWEENGTRLTYAVLVFIVTLPMYLWINSLQEQLQGVWMVVVGILVGKVRTSFGEVQDKLKEDKQNGMV